MKGNAKGSILLYAREHIVQELGTRTWSEILELLEPEDRVLLSGMPITSAWYPVGHWNRLMRVALPKLSQNPNDGMRVLAAHIAKQDLSTVYKLVFKAGSPEFLLRRTGQLWSRYYDTGTLVPEELGPRRWRLVLKAPIDPDVAPDAYTCGPGVSAWIANGLMLSGTEARVIETKCRFRGATHCEFDATW